MAATWPRDFTVVDVGGFCGMQGWLFGDFERYVCVDSYDLSPTVDGLDVGSRCELPDNGIHVRSDGIGYMRAFVDFPCDLRWRAAALGLRKDLFLCSAVPDERLREMVLEMPNSVVWYPGEPMRGTGPFAKATKAEFSRLMACGWHDEADRMVWAAENGNGGRKP